MLAQLADTERACGAHIGLGLTKREFLQCAGAGLALPWLESLTPAFGGPADADTKPKAARCVFIHIPFGVNMWRWFPKAFGPGADLGSTLAPLQRLADRVTVFSGLRQKNSGGYGESGLFLTGNPNFNGGKLYLTGNTISVDQHIAAARGRETSIPSLVLSVAGGQDTISWDASGTAMYGLCDLPLIYEKLFGSPEVLARGQRHQSILNVVGGAPLARIGAQDQPQERGGGVSAGLSQLGKRRRGSRAAPCPAGPRGRGQPGARQGRPERGRPEGPEVPRGPAPREPHGPHALRRSRAFVREAAQAGGSPEDAAFVAAWGSVRAARREYERRAAAGRAS